ncbi:MAG: undecaprenyl-diphosphate phosphatase [Maricaulaceae bacterium]
MTLFHLILLAIIQGLTEFLPVSSSAHLILPSQLFGWEDQGPLIDVMAHFGTLFAVIAYFWRDVMEAIVGFFDLIRRKMNKGSLLALNLILATPPALVLGAALHFSGLDEVIRSPLLIACTFIFFGIVLWIADIKGGRTRDIETLTWKEAIYMGLAQALALIPGTSRSGITMTAALAMGLTRAEAARFSMLMSIPIIAVGGLFAMIKLAGGETAGVNLTDGLIVAALSFVTAFAAIALFMKWVARIGMFPFMVYRVVAGLGLLLWVLL